MPDHIKFAFVIPANLNLNYFKVPQATVEIAVEGAEDPLTHQRMRDVVRDDFLATQKKVNDFIKSRDLQIGRLGVNERKRQKATLLKTGNESIERFLAEFKAKAETDLAEFARQEAIMVQKVAEANNSENWRNVRWVISVGWTGAKAIGGLVGAVGSSGAATPLVIKEFVDNLVDLKKLFDDLGDHYLTLEGARKRVRDGITTLKNKQRMSKSDVEAFANDVKLYEGKLLAMEVQARAISSRVNAALTSLPKEGLKPEAEKLAEETLDKSLNELTECAASIKAAETYLTTLKKNLAAARALAKDDAALTAVKNWAVTTYTKINDFKDVVLQPAELATWIDAVIKLFGDTRNVLEG